MVRQFVDRFRLGAVQAQASGLQFLAALRAGADLHGAVHALDLGKDGEATGRAHARHLRQLRPA
ncbi:hypothetical protein D3C86_2070410 [compost metagenome]